MNLCLNFYLVFKKFFINVYILKIMLEFLFIIMLKVIFRKYLLKVFIQMVLLKIIFLLLLKYILVLVILVIY